MPSPAHLFPPCNFLARCGQGSPQPSFCHDPLAFNCSGRNIEDLADLLSCQAAEKSHLDNSGLLRIERVQFTESFLQLEQIELMPVVNIQSVVQHDMDGILATALACSSSSRMIDKDAAHHAREDPEEVGAIL